MTSASLLPSLAAQTEQLPPDYDVNALNRVEQQLTELEQALASTNTDTDDLFSTFLASSTPHPSTLPLTGAGRMQSTSSTDSVRPTAPLSPSSLPPLSPVSCPSPLPSPVLSPIGSLPASPSSFSLSSDLSFSPSSPTSSESLVPARRKYTKRKASTSSTASTISTQLSCPTPSPFKRRGVKRELSPSRLEELDPATAKKERRKQQNRNAAATSREKKQKYMAEMEARIEKLINEQQALIDDVQRLREQNKQLTQRVHEKEADGVSELAGKMESIKSEPLSEDEEQSNQLQVSEHVSQDHVSACAESAVEAEFEETASECSEWSSEVSESRVVYHDSAVVEAPQWQTTRIPTPTAPLTTLTSLPLTSLCLFLHSTLLLLSITPALFLLSTQHQRTTPSSTLTISVSPTTTRRMMSGCHSPSEAATAGWLDVDGDDCSTLSRVSCFTASVRSQHSRPALVCR